MSESKTTEKWTVEEILKTVCDMLECCAKKCENKEVEMDAATALRTVASDVRMFI